MSEMDFRKDFRSQSEAEENCIAVLLQRRTWLGLSVFNLLAMLPGERSVKWLELTSSVREEASEAVVYML